MSPDIRAKSTKPHFKMSNEQCPMSSEQSGSSERRLEFVPKSPISRAERQLGPTYEPVPGTFKVSTFVENFVGNFVEIPMNLAILSTKFATKFPTKGEMGASGTGPTYERSIETRVL